MTGVRLGTSEITIEFYDASWIFDHFDLVKSCFPHLGHVDLEDVDLRVQGRSGVVVAKMGDLPIGFTIWYETLPGTAYIWLTGVVREYRGRGIGLQLHKTLLRYLRDEGFDAVWFKAAKSKYRWIKRHISMGFRIIEHVREANVDIYKLAMVFDGKRVVVV